MTTNHQSFRHARTRLSLRRRRFLGALGATAAALPLIPVPDSVAQEAGGHRRIIYLFSPNGTIYDEWNPSGGETDFTFREILSPLEGLEPYVTVIDGLRHPAGGPGSRHAQGPHKFMAGSRLLDGDQGGGGNTSSGYGSHQTADQRIADVVGQETPFSSLELGVQNGGANVRSRMAYRASNQPIVPEDNPYALFDRLFKDLDQDETSLERLRAERLSVIDAVSGQLRRVADRSGTADRVKLEAHLEVVRSIERRLENGFGANCVAPTVGDTIDHQADDNYQVVSELMLDQLVMAMACDLTRVSTLMWSRATSNQIFPFLGFTDKHHELSHEPDSNGAAQNKLVQINRFFAGQLRYLMDRLAEVPEGDGTMLDNTLIVWGNELGKGNSHTHRPVPIVLAGGAAGHFAMGRNLDIEETDMNRLLVSTLQFMGLDDDTFGNLDQGSGGLAALT
ncbi:MAG: DUF1552 domain-containing protein [Myxococcota bacterium]